MTKQFLLLFCLLSLFINAAAIAVENGVFESNDNLYKVPDSAIIDAVSECLRNEQDCEIEMIPVGSVADREAPARIASENRECLIQSIKSDRVLLISEEYSLDEHRMGISVIFKKVEGCLTVSIKFVRDDPDKIQNKVYIGHIMYSDNLLD
ncbi:MAG: hypothetical protein U0989_05235 [Azonexus sp.]|nr:hypothetical protein [Azonexus sp.]